MKRDFCHICDFSSGAFNVTSPSGGMKLTFEDSDRFGPSKLNARNSDISEITERHKWFWEWYPGWRDAGRPTTGAPISTPYGLIATAVGPTAD